MATSWESLSLSRHLSLSVSLSLSLSLHLCMVTLVVCTYFGSSRRPLPPNFALFLPSKRF